jgi:hypothetical protein
MHEDRFLQTKSFRGEKIWDLSVMKDFSAMRKT